MANDHPIAQVQPSALSDPRMSPQAVSVAAAAITGGDPNKLGMGYHNKKLALWELKRAGHLTEEDREVA